VDLHIQEDFTAPQLNPEQFSAEDYPGMSIVPAPARHAGHGSARFELPWDWARSPGVYAPACEARLRGRNTYGPRTTSNPIEFGPEALLGFSAMFPDGNVLGHPVTVMQFATGKTPPDRNGPPSLALRLMPDNRLMLRLRSAKTADIGDERIYAIDYMAGTAEPGRWYDFVLHPRFAFEDGFVRAWANGEQFADASGRTIGAVAIEQFVFAKVGIYAPALRENIVQPGVVQRVYISALRYGPPSVGFAGVDPAQWEREIDRAALRAWLDEGAQWVERGRGLVG